MPLTTPNLSAYARSLLPGMICLVLVALAGLSFTGYEFGRVYLLFPSLLLLALCLLPLLRLKPFDLPMSVLASAGLYIVAVIAATLLFHPELINSTFRNAMIMLALPWCLMAAGIFYPVLLQQTKLLLTALAVMEAALVGQIWFSYYTGWGEIAEMGDGIRRAFGVAGDSFTVLLVFFILLNLLREQRLRVVVLLITLCMSVGKLALLLTLLGSVLALPLLATRKQRIKAGVTLAVAMAIGLMLTSQTLRNVAEKPATQIEQAPVAVPQRAMVSHLVAGGAATGLGRMITVAAGYTMFAAHPLAGVGYGQSSNPAIFQPAVMADVLGLVDNHGVHPTRLTAERHIGNQLTLVAAEIGVIGLLPFLLFCLLACLLCLRVWFKLRAYKLSADAHALAGTCAVWSVCLIVFNQTAPWLLSAAAMSVWLAFTLGICAAAYRLSNDA